MSLCRFAVAVGVGSLLLASAAVAQPKRAGATRGVKAVDWTAELLTRADQVAVEVARVRGLPLKQPIQRDVVDVAELRRRLAARAARDKTAAELAAEETSAKRWGLVPPDTRYAELLVDVLTEQIAGYYDP